VDEGVRHHLAIVSRERSEAMTSDLWWPRLRAEDVASEYGVNSVH